MFYCVIVLLKYYLIAIMHYGITALMIILNFASISYCFTELQIYCIIVIRRYCIIAM